MKWKRIYNICAKILRISIFSEALNLKLTSSLKLSEVLTFNLVIKLNNLYSFCLTITSNMMDFQMSLQTTHCGNICLLQFEAYHNTFDKQWAKRLSASLSWAEDADEDDEDFYREEQLLRVITVKPVLRNHSKRRIKIGFQDGLSLNAGQKYCRMLQESILQYF